MKNEPWKHKETWRTIRESYRLMKALGAGFRTQFVQGAYAECWVAWKLDRAGYDITFHPKGCDVAIRIDKGEHLLRFEVKHSEDNKDKNKNGHGYSSWRISQAQVKEMGKFDLCLLIRDSLRDEEPDATYVFSRKEIVDTVPIFDEGQRLDYYLWYSEYFEEIRNESQWMNKAANSLVQQLNKNPDKFEKRWKSLLDGKLDASALVR